MHQRNIHREQRRMRITPLVFGQGRCRDRYRDIFDVFGPSYNPPSSIIGSRPKRWTGLVWATDFAHHPMRDPPHSRSVKFVALYRGSYRQCLGLFPIPGIEQLLPKGTVASPGPIAGHGVRSPTEPNLRQKCWMNPMHREAQAIQSVCIRFNSSRLCRSSSRARLCAARASAE
jgi:hypothetical protein